MSSQAFVIFRAEVAHLVRRPLMWIAVAVLTLISWGMSTGKVTISSGDSSVGGKVAWVSSQFSVFYLLSVLLLVYLFFVSIAGGMAIVRDEEANLGPLIHPTPLTARAYVLGKAGAVLATYGLVLALNLAVMMASNHLLHSMADDWIGPFSLSSYLAPGLVLGLPTVAAFTGVSAWVGERFRRAMPVFVMPVVIALLGTFLLWLYNPSWLPPTVDQALMIADPFAMRWLEHRFLDVDRGADFYNHAAIGLDPILVANRVVWMSLGGLGLWAAVRSRYRAMRGVDTRVRRTKAVARAATPKTPSPMGSLADLRQTVTLPSTAKTAWSVGRFELRALLRQPGIYLFVPLILVQVIQKTWGVEGPFGMLLRATVGTVAVESLNWLSTMLCLLTLFYTVESLHRERQSGVSAIVYTTPAKSGAIVMGKVAANVAVALAALVLLAVLSTAALMVQGEVSLAPWPWLLVWGGLLLPTFALWTTFVAFLYAVTGHRYATYGVALAVLAATGYGVLTGEVTWVTNWPLWSALRWSDISVFELDRQALVLSRMGALGLATVFGLGASVLMPRRDRDRARAESMWVLLRLDELTRRRGRLAIAMLVALVPLGALGRAIASGPQGDAAEDAAEDYRRAHRDTFKDALVPGMAGVDVALVFEPDEERFEVKGEMTVINHHDVPIRSIPVTVGRHFEDMTWTVHGEPHQPELRAGLAIFSAEPPLEPGKRFTFGFSYRGRHPDGTSKAGRGSQQFIVPSGVVFTSFEPTLFPVVGYVEGIGVDEDNELEPAARAEDFHRERLDPVLGSPTPFHTRIAIEAPADLTFNAVGLKTAEREEAGRRHVVWESDHPVRFFNVVGGRWTERQGDGVRVFHHPEHHHSVGEMIAALEGSREHFSRWFAPYPWKELKLSEFPALATYAQGFPTNITFAEGIGFLAKEENHGAFIITAHEAAHQWWGNMVTPGDGPGSSVIGEGLAHFSALLLLDEVKGDEARQQFAKVIEDRYLKERRRDGERALRRVDGSRKGDTTLVYEKAGYAYWMLMRHMGREAMLAGLADFVAAYRDGPDFPAVADMLAVLREHAPNGEAFDAFAGQLFGEVVLPEYRLDGLRAEATGNGWRVTAELENAGTGRFPVEIACDGAAGSTTVVVGSNEVEGVAVVCDAEPGGLVVDPNRHVLQNARAAARASL